MSQPLPTRSEHLVPAERRRQIFELLHERGSIAVADIEELFRVSTMTARRDLTLLAEEGLSLVDARRSGPARADRHSRTRSTAG